MKKKFIIALLTTVSLILLFSHSDDNPAVKFLNSLNQNQRDKAQLPFDDTSRTFWHFIPGSRFPRPGIQLNEINTSQKELVNELLQSFLSETGYLKTKKIIALENVLLEITGDSVKRDPGKYFVAFYGNPEIDSLWAWSFEGHHLSLNFTVLNGKTIIAPRFIGASPATIPSGTRKGERTLDKEEDLGLELINSFTGEQRKLAIFKQKPFSNIVTGNSIEVDPLAPVGIKFEEMNHDQQLVFLTLLNEYLSTIPAIQAEKRMENIKKEEMDEVRFAWAGATVSGEGHYYRIQGKSFLIEFDNTQSNANHIHTVWRDFNGDFGRDLIREHYKYSKHHKHD
ncbi:DUF3500 domain-containing protein [Mangrovivirga sp. M17]|uniref:DUF3500 domain-containing protein n=1 Tax=Mangrovivirga halotolerans TaxID=2993936 RepID=A0ABT3RQB3_9BACT|nr:DUF3500 domain-containing protein [Mangrovivirga halotolerans]MCX2743772.1 DUF3500 domain-containing protein [Mangrovivirga halotolerans]